MFNVRRAALGKEPACAFAGSLASRESLLACQALAAADPGPWDAERFEKKIRPLLAARCWQCHGSEKSKGGLRLDSAAAIETGGDSGPVVVPGKPGESRLIEAIRYTGELKMPPKGKLSDAEIAELAEWVPHRCNLARYQDRTAAPARASCGQRSSLHLRTKAILGLSATARTGVRPT